jgi:hypothetical protein
MPPDTTNSSPTRQTPVIVSDENIYPRYLAGHLDIPVRSEAPQS